MPELLSILIDRWQEAALEAQAYRRITEGKAEIKRQLDLALSSSPISDRRNLANEMRKRVNLALANGDQGEVSGLLGELKALLGHTPSEPDPFPSVPDDAVEGEAK